MYNELTNVNKGFRFTVIVKYQLLNNNLWIIAIEIHFCFYYKRNATKKPC